MQTRFPQLPEWKWQQIRNNPSGTNVFKEEDDPSL